MKDKMYGLFYFFYGRTENYRLIAVSDSVEKLEQKHLSTGAEATLALCEEDHTLLAGGTHYYICEVGVE